MHTTLGRTCTACGVERKPKHLLYDPNTFLPYCHNPYICNDKHPDSPKNIIERGSLLGLRTYEEVENLYKEQLLMKYANAETIDRIRRLTQKPTTVRVQDPDLAQFLVETEKELGFDSISDTIRYCIRTVMENKHLFKTEYRQMEQEKRAEDNMQKVIEEIAEPVTTSIEKKEEKEDNAEEEWLL